MSLFEHSASSTPLHYVQYAYMQYILIRSIDLSMYNVLTISLCTYVWLHVRYLVCSSVLSCVWDCVHTVCAFTDWGLSLPSLWHSCHSHIWQPAPSIPQHGHTWQQPGHLSSHPAVVGVYISAMLSGEQGSALREQFHRKIRCTPIHKLCHIALCYRITTGLGDHS